MNIDWDRISDDGYYLYQLACLAYYLPEIDIRTIRRVFHNGVFPEYQAANEDRYTLEEHMENQVFNPLIEKFCYKYPSEKPFYPDSHPMSICTETFLYLIGEEYEASEYFKLPEGADVPEHLNPEYWRHHKNKNPKWHSMWLDLMVLAERAYELAAVFACAEQVVGVLKNDPDLPTIEPELFVEYLYIVKSKIEHDVNTTLTCWMYETEASRRGKKGAVGYTQKAEERMDALRKLFFDKFKGKNSLAFRTEAMRATGYSEDYIKRKLKGFKNER